MSVYSLVVLSNHRVILILSVWHFWNGERTKWTEQLNLYRLSLFITCMMFFHENEENIHFCKCYQSLTIKNSLGKRNGVALQNCGYYCIVLFTVNLA